MNLKLTTPLIEAVMKRISKGMGRNRVLPYTYRIQINMRMDKLQFTATDGNIFYTETINIPFEGDNQFIEDTIFCVDGDSLINLIKNIGKETFELILDETSLKVKSSGTYTFERINEPFNMPDVTLSKDAKAYALTARDVDLLNPVKSGLTSDAIALNLLGYYLTENYLVTTSGVKLCTVKGLSQKIEQPLYLTQRYVELLQMFGDNEIILAGGERIVLASTKDKMLYGVQHPGKENFPKFKAVLGIENPIKISANALYLQQVLNRLKIFNPETVFLKVVNAQVYLMADTKGDSQEEIITLTTSGLSNISNRYNINALIELLSAHTGDVVNLGFGKDSVLILTSEGITQALAPIKGEEDGKE